LVGHCWKLHHVVELDEEDHFYNGLNVVRVSGFKTKEHAERELERVVEEYGGYWEIDSEFAYKGGPKRWSLKKIVRDL